MSDQTGIQWTDSTWNVVTGCTRVSPGCARCYIERTPPFRMEGRVFARVGNEETTGVRLHLDRLDQPLHWRKPRRVFVCSLADLFHEDVPDELIARVFDTMRLAPQHIFQVLTKRPERAREWFDRWHSAFERFVDSVWPLPNVWLGTSVENARYTWRADVLREIPAVVRFISAEPLLGSLVRAGVQRACERCSYGVMDAGNPHVYGGCVCPCHGERPKRPLDLAGIDWVIIGGESGPGARPFHLEHARELIRACRCPECGGHGWTVETRTVTGTSWECCGQYVTDHYGNAVGCCEQPVAVPVPEPEQYQEQCARCYGTGGPAVFVKQLGARPYVGGVEGHLDDAKGGDWDEWPDDLRIREWPRLAVAA